MLRIAATGLEKNIIPNREKQRSKSRSKLVGLDVCLDEADVREARRARVAPPLLQERVTAVEPEHRPVGTGLARELDRCVAPAAADVEDLRSARHVQCLERNAAVIREPVQQDVAEPLELRDEDVVPERGERVVGDSGIAHDTQSRGREWQAQSVLRTPVAWQR